MRGNLAKAFDFADLQLFRRAPAPKSCADLLGRKLFLFLRTAQGLAALAFRIQEGKQDQCAGGDARVIGNLWRIGTRFLHFKKPQGAAHGDWPEAYCLSRRTSPVTHRNTKKAMTEPSSKPKRACSERLAGATVVCTKLTPARLVTLYAIFAMPAFQHRSGQLQRDAGNLLCREAVRGFDTRTDGTHGFHAGCPKNRRKRLSIVWAKRS